MPRDAVKLCGKTWETQKDLAWNKDPLQCQKWRNRLTKKLEESNGQSCDKSWKFLVCGWQDEKDRHVITGIIPCVVVTSLETDAFVAFVAYIDMLMVRSNFSAVARKEGTQGTVAPLKKKKKNVQGCAPHNSDPMNSVLRKAGELGLNASAGHTWNSQDATGTKLNSGKEKGNLEAVSQKGEPRGQNPCAPGFEEWTLEEIARQADCDSKVAWNLEREKSTMLRKRDFELS